MLRETRDQGRSAGIAGPLLLGALIVLSSCGPTPRRSDATTTRPIDPGIFVEYTKVLDAYIKALLLLGSDNPADRAEAKRKLDALGFAYFAEDRMFLEKLRTGTPDDMEVARRELARRGRMLDLILVFTRPYAQATWDHARRELLAIGEGGPEFLTISLLKILLNGQFRPVWSHIRFQLVEIGTVARETTAALAKERADATPETPIWKQEDLVQLLLVLISFGAEGRPAVAELAKHRVWNVRKAVARAVGEAVDPALAEILVGYLKGDPEWQVKAAAAEAIGRLRPARRTLGPVLVERMKAERDRFVLHAILRAIGEIRYLDAIPDLMNAIQVPNYDTAQVAMEALYFLTGKRLTTVPQWQRWYRDEYPAWIKEQRP
ncbi:MAG: HEAT repeat domain-containing protein [Planctomycetes bacterium]|nr:HEAT repeat domain-containing protein [Planctomycetota bacterium]